jgi:GxxExxY protein
MVEIKAMDRLTAKEEAQILNYLKAAKIEVGVLINLGASPRLEWSRHIWSEELHSPQRRAKARSVAP